jgi:hypothetical protein
MFLAWTCIKTVTYHWTITCNMHQGNITVNEVSNSTIKTDFNFVVKSITDSVACLILKKVPTLITDQNDMWPALKFTSSHIQFRFETSDVESTPVMNYLTTSALHHCKY